MRYYLLLALLACWGCTPSVTLNVISQPNPSKPIGCHIDIYRDIDIYQDPTFIKKPYDVIATMKLRDSGFSIECHRQVGMKIIRDEACMVGGDAVILSQEKNPDAWSTCYRADVSIIAYKNKEDEI